MKLTDLVDPNYLSMVPVNRPAIVIAGGTVEADPLSRGGLASYILQGTVFGVSHS